MTAYDELLEICMKYGRSEFDHAVKRLMRTRVDKGDRDRRKKVSVKTRNDLYFRQGGKCPRCGKVLLDPMEVDHIEPISRGGKDVPWNMRLLHAKCNREKSDADLVKDSKRTGNTIMSQL